MSLNLTEIPWYKVNPKDGSELVLVPGGWFWMGSGDEDPYASGSEKPRHMHYVEPFYFGIACVTVAQFRNFMKETKHAVSSDWPNDPGEHPVRQVSSNAAAAYCAWAGLRLPSEAEWELAARGYAAMRYPWGDDWEDGRRVCWGKQIGPKGSTAPVFDHPDGVSPFGSFQQSGNLWEWCADAWDGKTFQGYALGDFSVPSESGLLRGGSWNDVNPRYFRGGYRNVNYPDGGYDSRGLRVAGTVTF